MTEYVFKVKCIRSYTTGGTTVWNKDDIYICKTTDFVSFCVCQNKADNHSSNSYFELSPKLFHNYFVVADTLSKLPLNRSWLSDEEEPEHTQFFEFVKSDIARICSASKIRLSDATISEVAYNLLCQTEPEDESCLYKEYLSKLIALVVLDQCG